MHSEPTKLVFTGLFVGVVAAAAIVAFVSQSGRHWSSTDELGPARDDSAANEMRADMMSGTVTPAPLVARSNATGAADAAAVADDLQAARESLQRNDLAAAQAQLNAVEPGHEDDTQVRALQREVQARADSAALAGSASQRISKQARTTSSTLTKSTRARESHENRLASRQHSSHAASDAQRRHVSQTKTGGPPAPDAASLPTEIVAPANPLPAVPAGQMAPVLAPQAASQAAHQTSQPASQPASQQTTQPAAEQPAVERAQQAAPQTIPTAQSAPQTPLAPTGSPTVTQIRADSGPKTRAQVREEIVRARSDGSLPAFGNPDPAGPGGAPSMSLAPRP